MVKGPSYLDLEIGLGYNGKFRVPVIKCDTNQISMLRNWERRETIVTIAITSASQIQSKGSSVVVHLVTC